MNDDQLVNVESHVFYKSLKSRFYILLTFSLFNFLCGFQWNAWSPIMISIKEIYNWGQTDINLQPNFFPIAFCLFAVPVVYIWNKEGLRVVYFCSSSLLVVGTFIRLYPGSVYMQSALLQIGNAISSIGAVMSLIAPTVISMLWFPSGERARATALPLSFNTLGTAIAPIIATFMVPVLDANETNSIVGKNAIESGIRRYEFLQCSMALIVLTMIIVYFPERPHILPCKSSENSLRLDLWPGIKVLLKKKQFWIAFIVNMIVYGVNSGVSAVSVTYVLPMGVTQKQAGYMGFLSNLISFVAIFMGGWLGDKYGYKRVVVASVFPTFVVYSISGLQCMNIIPQKIWIMYVISISQGLFTNFACAPSFEMGVESAFPVSENVSNAVLAFATNFGSMWFLSLCMIPSFGTTWIPFFYAVISLAILPVMWFYKDEKNRMKYDAIINEDDVFEVSIDRGIERLSDQSPLLDGI